MSPARGQGGELIAISPEDALGHLSEAVVFIPSFQVRPRPSDQTGAGAYKRCRASFWGGSNWPCHFTRPRDARYPFRVTGLPIFSHPRIGR